MKIFKKKMKVNLYT